MVTNILLIVKGNLCFRARVSFPYCALPNFQGFFIKLSAALVMYEQAFRFGQESHSASIITKQAQCLLTCITSLHLVRKEYQWIVRPTMEENYPNEKDPKMKRDSDGKEILHFKVKKQVEVLTLEDIRKEYAIVQAKLTLAKHSMEMHTITQAGAFEENP